MSIVSENLEIDKEVAIKVMGCSETPSIWYKDYDKDKKYYHVGGSPASEEVSLIEYEGGEWSQHMFSPSRYINDAWLVVENLKNKRTFTLTQSMEDNWRVRFGDYESYEETAPLAICKAALKAVSHD